MSEADCLFCKIAAGEIPAEIVSEGPDWVAFRDISPQAPTHVLIIPREHIATLNDVDAGGAALLGQLLLAAKEIAADEGIAESGYRTVFNCNAGAGQSVFHIHVHLLGGRDMGWPPG
jgi:histidine triad (HIT) family protein